MNDLDIFTIEQHIYNNDYSAAATLLNKIIVDLRKGNAFAASFSMKSIDPTLTAIYTRLAKCISKIFIDITHYPLDFVQFSFWSLYGRELRAIFSISGFYRTDFIIKTLNLQLQSAIEKQSKGTNCLAEIEQIVMRIFLFFMLENTTAVNFNIFFNFFPQVTLVALLNLLSTSSVVTLTGAHQQEALFTMMPLLEKLTITHPYHLYDVAATWLQCSYISRRDKHTIKKYLNNSLVAWAARENFLQHISCKAYDPTLFKPTMLVVLEYFTAAHSMGRSYQLALASLKTKFNLIGLALHAQEGSDQNYSLFDNIIYLEGVEGSALNIDKLPAQLQKISSLQVDLVFYPSLGMNYIAIILANLRLAPIQLMCFGHPASSFCDTIDYGLIEDDYTPEALDLFSEKMIALPPESFISQPLAYLKQLELFPKKSKDIIYIAVPAVTAKLSAIFLQTCQKILAQAQRRIIFKFFINDSEIFYLQCKKDILYLIQEAEVYQRLSIEDYLHQLSSCDMYLSTFPFGGANSIIDAMGVGLPVVCLRGEDIAGRTDSALIARRGLPSWLITHTAEDYINAALRLIHNDEERLTLNKFILEHRQELFPDNNPNYQKNLDYFANACYEVYQKHALLQKSSKKLFSLAELRSLHQG